MDVTDQFQQVGILIADERFVPALVEVTRAIVAEIEVKRIPGEQSPHERRKAGFAWPKKEVKYMIGHQRPGKAFGAGLNKELGKTAEESPPFGIDTKDVATVYTTDDYMLQQAGNVDSRGSWHVGKAAAEWVLVNK